MAIADGGELVVLAPGVKEFGEDARIDELIRKYGYRTSPEILAFVEGNRDLMKNLSAAAHLIHGSSEGRFSVTYAPGHLTREEVEGVGYLYADYAETKVSCLFVFVCLFFCLLIYSFVYPSILLFASIVDEGALRS